MTDCDTAIKEALELVRLRKFQEAIGLLEPAERKAESQGQILDRIRLLRHIGICRFEQNDLVSAESTYQECLQLANKIDSDLERVNAYHELSLIYYRRHQLDKAIDVNKEAVRILNSPKPLPGIERMGGKEHHLAQHAQTLGILFMEKGDLEKSERALRMAEKTFEAISDKPGLARTLNELGLLALQQSEPIKSAEAFFRSILLKFEMKDAHGIQGTLQNVNVLLQRHPEAREVPCIRELIAILNR